MAVYQDSEFFAPRNPSLISIAAHRVVDFLDKSLADLHRYVVRSQTESALSKLSDRQLEDIGISRSEIAKVSARAARRWG